MSARKERERRREERLQEEAAVAAEERRRRLVQVVSAAAFLAIVAVAVAIVVSANRTGGGDTDIEGAAEVNRSLAAIPQRGTTLGDPKAPVTVIEYGDLQCPVCKAYAEGPLSELIAGPVRAGKAKLDFRNYTIIGPQSAPAGAAALAAAAQGRGWSFIELFYRNQGAENSGYADDAFLTAIARAAGVPDIARWNRDRRSDRITSRVSATTSQAERIGFTGTPSFAVEGPATNGIEPIGTPGSASGLEEAIQQAR